MSVAERVFMADGVCMRNRLHRTLFAAAVATAAFAVGAPAANAGLLVASAKNCSPKPTIKAFAGWGDSLDYQPAPGGTFEVGDEAWSLKRASLVSENEPWKVHGANDKRSLKLPPGASATSPVMCVGVGEPLVRLFARNNSALLSTLTVEVTFQTSLGLKATLPFGVILPSGKWKPSPRFYMLVNLLPLLPGAKTPVQFTVRSVGLGTWFVDDFYVDPRCR
jgi:hypothetical protein